MKQHLLVAVTLVLLGAVSSNAQSFIGPEVKLTDGQTSTLLNGLLQKMTPIGTSEQAVGFYVYGAVTDTAWGQLHGGVSYNPRKWIGLTVGVGTERNEDPWRVAGSAFVEGRGNVAFLIMEHGGGGFWYRAQYARVLNSRVNLGIFSRRFSPTGPIIEVKVTKRYMLWTAIGPDLETGQMTSVLGLNIAIP